VTRKLASTLALGLAAGALLTSSLAAGTALAAGQDRAAATAASPRYNRDIYPVHTFYPGDAVRSDRARLIMQQDGNLVVYDEYGTPRWASNTVGSGYRAVLQDDGNFVVYSRGGGPVWASNTSWAHGAHLSVQDDGNVVLYLGSRPIWATGTEH
jgi:hypothetical protein